MPSAQAQAHDHDGGRTEGDVAPLSLADVDRLLLESARVAHAGPAAPVRTWRADLTEALAVLSYAETVLAGDAALLRHCLTGVPVDHKAVLDDMARTLSGGDDLGDAAAAVPVEETLFARADLSEPAGVRRLLDDVEAQLEEVGTRQREVEARLTDIRAVVVRQYREGIVPPAESWLR